MQVNIKNPNIYRATLPAANVVAEHLASLPFQEMEIGSSLLATHGFLPNPATNELVTPFHGGYAFFLRRDEKVIPAGEVKKEFNRRIKVMVDAGTPVTRKDKQAIKDDVIATLATRAFTRPTVVECYYNQDADLLFITGSPKLAQFTLAQILKCLGTMTTSTIHVDGIKRGLTTCLQAFQKKAIDEGEECGKSEFAELEVCETIILQHPETGEKLGLDNIDPLACVELDSALERGFLITSIRLLDASGMAFTLTNEFRLQRIKWPSIDHQDDDDAVHRWRNEAAVQLLQLTSVVERLCQLLGAPIESTSEA